MIARMWRGWVPTEKAAEYYPEDDAYLLDREETVSHFEVVAPPAS